MQSLATLLATGLLIGAGACDGTTNLLSHSIDSSGSSIHADAAKASSTSLGTYSLLDESASSGNSMTVDDGTSIQGGGLTTYWQPSTGIMDIYAMGNNQFKIVETIGGRCITVSNADVRTDTCTGAGSESNDQLFALNKQSDGSYTIVANDGLCLNAAAAFTSVNAVACKGSTGERWNFSGSTPFSTNPPIVNSPTVPAGYHLTFDDEFQSLSISDKNGAGTNWYSQTIKCCMYDTSNPSTPTYMAGISWPQGEDPFSLVSGGGLDIRLQKTNGAWYSGVIATVDQNGAGFSQQYGYFEMKASFPSGLGTWPAFWLLNDQALTKKAAAGEIDVVESYMFAPTYVNTTLHNWTPPASVLGYKQSQTANLADGFHVYGMLWTASTMTFYCDGAVIYQLATPAMMKQPYYPIIDLGLGGGWPTNKTPQKSDMIVEYMRVYAP